VALTEFSDYVLLCDKPAGVTSHDVVAGVRRGLPGTSKVGHAGTLDPFATGLLLVLVGRATRVQRFLMALPKTYEAVARFGAVSSTGDPEGKITVTGRVPGGSVPLPTGRIRQRPPAYSAVKVGGQRAYRLARAGKAVELPEREVEVHRFEQRWAEGDRRGFVIECSSGTYVRSLIAALGDAYCEALRRTHIGRFDVADAGPESAVALSDALDFLPAVELDADRARVAGHGVAVEVPERAEPAAETTPAGAERGEPAAEIVRLIDGQGLIALARPGSEPGTLKPFVGLR
jgi:tRNA pseudouridine55 synthase